MDARMKPDDLPVDAVVLWIGRSESECGACGLTCLPGEPTHSLRCGYDQHEGCGARYTHVASIYIGREVERRVREMRPDLPFVVTWDGAR